MKYSIGDRVIDRVSGEKGLVCEIIEEEYYKVYVYDAYGVENYEEKELQIDLTAIEKPFGLLSKEVQGELKAVDNGKNIQFFSDILNGWCNTGSPNWAFSSTYHLDPNWKQEEVKEMTVGEIEAKLGHRVKVVKEVN